MADKDIYNTGKNIMLVFAPDGSGEPDRVVIERGVHRDTTEFFAQIGEMIASRSGLPFPEAIATLDSDGPVVVRVPLPDFGNGASGRCDSARNVLAAAAKALLRAAITDGVSVSVATAAGPRKFTVEAVPATASAEMQNEQVGPDVEPRDQIVDNALREEF